MPDYQLAFNLREQNAAVLKLSGWVNFNNATAIYRQGNELTDQTVSSGIKMLIVDVAEVKTSQSVLLSLLLRWRVKLNKASCSVKINGLSEQMRRVSEVTGIAPLLPE